MCGKYIFNRTAPSEVLEETNQEGTFDFAPPIIDDMKILLLIDKAYGSEFEINKEDFQQDEKSGQETAPLPTKAPK